MYIQRTQVRPTNNELSVYPTDQIDDICRLTGILI